LIYNPAVTIDLSYTLTDPSCAGNDGSVVIHATGGNTPYTYSIDGGLTFFSDSVFSNLPDTSYSVMVDDNLVNQESGTATLNYGGSPPTLTSLESHPTCGINNGE